MSVVADEIPGYTPKIVIKFREDIGLQEEPEASRELERFVVGSGQSYPDSLHKVSIERLVTALSPDRVNELVRIANANDRNYTQPDFLSFFTIDIVPGMNTDRMLEDLRRLSAVEETYVDSPPEDAGVGNVSNPSTNLQGYLDAADAGIDARYAWTVTGGNGAGQYFADVEKGWTLDHDELDYLNIPPPLVGTIQNSSRRHGTSVLGIVCAEDNELLGIGVVPKLESVKVASHHDSNLVNAILASIDDLPPGGVILIPVQFGYTSGLTTTWYKVPIEVQRAERDAIRLATSYGITVVVAAGNGGNNLDSVDDAMGKYVLNRQNEIDFRDSGSIMVGSSFSAVPHNRFSNSNFGDRVDCYAWGESIFTTDTTTNIPFDITGSRYFGETSGASSIVAGAALSVQGIAQYSLQYHLSAFEMRSLLSDENLGTASANPAYDQIGVMPNLEEIISSGAIGAVPDVYLRDFIGDTGNAHNGGISASPDIILRPDLVPNIQGAFGEGSGTENDNGLGFEATVNQDNYIYVRARNRGGAAASNVVASVYWSEVSTLITPDTWQHIGDLALASLPAGNVLTTFTALTWPAAEIPGPGHYCFVALIKSDLDDAQLPPDLDDFDQFIRLIRDSNNFTWRNFNVIDIAPQQSGESELDFWAAGAADRPIGMALEIGARLPQGSKITLEFPMELYDLLPYRLPLVEKHDSQRTNTALIRLNPHGSRMLGKIPFAAKDRFRSKIRVAIPPNQRNGRYEVYARQLFGDLEVGRVTWRLEPGVNKRLEKLVKLSTKKKKKPSGPT